jgi:hypothetical protein
LVPTFFKLVPELENKPENTHATREDEAAGTDARAKAPMRCFDAMAVVGDGIEW